jgi:2-polyprenyl-3-methyl-5-hydroxy-6-metoxy-1,4-benzoquinol methylase
MHPLSVNINCPACYKNEPVHVFECVDHSFSHEIFSIWQCEGCKLRFTYPIPEETNIGRYYEASHYISHSDSSEGFINKLYKLARRFTLSEKRRFVQRQTGMPNGHLLDVGAGTGAFMNEMIENGWETIGVEPDYGARQKAYQLHKLSIFESAYLFELSHNSFNAITLWHVLEHVYDLHGYLHQFGNLLKKSGLLFIAVPNYTGYDGSYYQSYWAAYDVPRHLYHFSPRSIEALAAKHEFTIVKRKPMWLDAVYISMLSENYKHGRNRNLVAVFRGVVATVKTIISLKKASSLIYVLKKK